MVPSPRARAPPTTTPAFIQTWDKTDAALLNPDTLPLAKIPRGWERKQEVKKAADGKAKKIWRRFNLRSRAEEGVEQHDDEDPEEKDVRARAVKRRQHISPKAMEKTATTTKGKKRAFKATRWDRRKSVLPRKKIAQADDFAGDNEEAFEQEDSIQDTSGYSLESADDSGVAVDSNSIPAQSLVSEGSDRRATFTFAMEMPDMDHHENEQQACGNISPVEEPLDSITTEDATLTNLFRTPAKSTSRASLAQRDTLTYPTLPKSPEDEPMAQREHQDAVDEVEHELAMETGDDLVSVSCEQDAPATEAEQHEEVSTSKTEHHEDMEEMHEVEYPTLLDEVNSTPISPSVEHHEAEDPDTFMPDTTFDTSADAVDEDDSDVPRASIEPNEGPADDDDAFTEASLQLDIQQQCDQDLQEDAQNPENVEVHTEIESESFINSPPSVNQMHQINDSESIQQSALAGQIDDITDGLTLSLTSKTVSSAEPTPRKLLSPPPPLHIESGPEDATMTMAFDDDTAILKDFLTRAAASKAERAATHRRESIQNRRDSDVVRHALASPRKVLEDKDPNSPSKHNSNDLTLDLSSNLVLNMPADEAVSPNEDLDAEEAQGDKTSRGSRRSSRTKKSRLPAPAAAAPPPQSSKIAIRRADGNEMVVLKKSDAQELATLTKANTRKNKQGAFGVSVRLLKLAVDAANLSPIDDTTKELVVGKNVRWDTQLAYYQENPETIAEAESLATPDELSMPDSKATTPKARKSDKNSTPKVRRVRGLGTVNGTPGKGLLAPAALLPDAVQEEIEAERPTVEAPRQIPRPKASKIKKMQVASNSVDDGASSNPTEPTILPPLKIAPVGITPTPTAQRKSRLAAPKKVVLPQPTTTATPTANNLSSAGKENTQRTGISDATPRKGIPAPRVMVPPTAPVTVDSALPRRRGRKY